MRWNQKTPLRGVFQKLSVFHSFFHLVFHWGIQSPTCAMSHVTYPSFFITTIICWLPIPATPPPTLWPQPWTPYPWWPPMWPWTTHECEHKHKGKCPSKCGHQPKCDWTKCEHQCEHRYPHQAHVHEASHDACTSDACQQPDGPTIHTMAH